MRWGRAPRGDTTQHGTATLPTCSSAGKSFPAAARGSALLAAGTRGPQVRPPKSLTSLSQLTCAIAEQSCRSLRGPAAAAGGDAVLGAQGRSLGTRLDLSKEQL